MKNNIGGRFYTQVIVNILYSTMIACLIEVVELQTTIRTETLFLGFAYLHRLASLCLRHCSTCVAQVIRGMMI